MFTVIARDPNSWLRTAQGDYHTITYECGHRHRTLAGAIRCAATLRGTTASLHARVETAAKDQQCAGEPVAQDDAYYAAEQATR